MPQLQNVEKGDYVVYEDSYGGLHLGWITRVTIASAVRQLSPHDSLVIWEDAAPRIPADSYVSPTSFCNSVYLR